MTSILAIGLAGLFLLTIGAEILVRGAARLGSLAGIGRLAVGLTIVAFGTSAPEMAVSVGAALSGSADIALGNVVGSNIFNVLFILGACAAIRPLVVSRQLIRKEVPVMIATSLLVTALAWNGSVGRAEGLLLLALLAVYTVQLLRAARREKAPEEPRKEWEGGWLLSSLLVVAGLGLLVFGARLFVGQAVAFSRWLGVSEAVIGLTIVAAGTSLPEVAASVVATWKGEREIAVGNVVGSNLFNLLAVLGASALISPSGVGAAPAFLSFDLPVMLAAMAACLPIFWTGHSIARWEGGLFLLYYAAYTLFLILNASGHDRLPLFDSVMWLFVIPLTLVTLAIGMARRIRSGNPAE